MAKKRESWGSKLGIILAVAGSAVGLGNFLRFPVQAANNGGGAFMIPYFISLLLLGLPLMWIEWAVGRYGGVFGHGTAPGMFDKMWKNRFIKYFGVIGIFGPLIIFIYYTYIESWLLAYAFFALTGKLAQAVTQTQMSSFLSAFQGITPNEYFSNIWIAYTFFIITFLMNSFVIYKGISGGIEWLCNWALPVLFLAGIAVMVRVLTLGSPNMLHPDWNVINGLGYLWNPDFSALLKAKVWLAAAGQIFFTLSVGIGVILTYASYLKKNDDIVRSGLTASMANEFAEVILGGSIAITAAFMFFGPKEIVTIAQSGAFNLGFVTMPLIFGKISFGMFFAFLWFLLLFLAGTTSSVSLAQPSISFMEDEFHISKKKAVAIFSSIAFILCQPAIFFISKGVVSELDFWGGTFALVLFATIETILFAWVFGMDKAWKEIHHGADMELPVVYKFVIKYVTPTILLAILAAWTWQDGLPLLLMRGVAPENVPYIAGTRIMLVVVFLGLMLAVKFAWRKKKR
jgi:neurotransmitter:Na+ symporter, NSS family